MWPSSVDILVESVNKQQLTNPTAGDCPTFLDEILSIELIM